MPLNEPHSREAEKVDWMNSIDDWREAVNAQLETVGKALVGFKSELEENTASTKRIELNTAATVSAFNSIQGGMKTLEWLGKLAAALTAIGVFCGGVWYYFTHGFSLPPR